MDITFAHYRNRFCMFRTYYALAVGKVKPDGINMKVIELADPPSKEQEEALIRGDVQAANLYLPNFLRRKLQGAPIRGSRFRPTALELQNMSELQMRVGSFRTVGDRRAIGGFGLGMVAAFLQRMTVLDPDRRIARVAVERDAIEIGCELPLPRFAGAVGAADDRRFATLAVEQRHRPYSVKLVT